MRVLLGGACGRMGCELRRLFQTEADAVLAAGVDPRAGDKAHLYRRYEDATEAADVLIDFSAHEATGEAVRAALARKIPLVSATTGQTAEELALLAACAEKIPVFRAANLSLGVALLAELTARAARFFPDADAEIIERHHGEKADAPSGTALLLAERISSARGGATLVCGRRGDSPRGKREIGIHSLRQGALLGTHEVIFATEDEVLTLRHETQSRALFARGALAAAKWLCQMPAGLYGMRELAAHRGEALS